MVILYTFFGPFGKIPKGKKWSNANEKPFEALPYQVCNLVDR
jgi:hypothetical protein